MFGPTTIVYVPGADCGWNATEKRLSVPASRVTLLAGMATPPGPVITTSPASNVAGSIASLNVTTAPSNVPAGPANTPVATTGPVVSAPPTVPAAVNWSADWPLVPSAFWSIGLPARSSTFGPTAMV